MTPEIKLQPATRALLTRLRFAKEKREKLDAELRDLRLRAVLRLIEEERLSYDEAGEVLGVTKGRISQMIAEVRAKPA